MGWNHLHPRRTGSDGAPRGASSLFYNMTPRGAPFGVLARTTPVSLRRTAWPSSCVPHRHAPLSCKREGNHFLPRPENRPAFQPSSRAPVPPRRQRAPVYPWQDARSVGRAAGRGDWRGWRNVSKSSASFGNAAPTQPFLHLRRGCREDFQVGVFCFAFSKRAARPRLFRGFCLDNPVPLSIWLLVADWASKRFTAGEGRGFKSRGKVEWIFLRRPV